MRPSPFSDVTGIGNEGAWEGATGTDCVLRSNISTTIGASLRGSYTKAVLASESRLKVRFHVDLSQLGSLTPLQATSLVNIVSAAPQSGYEGNTAALAQMFYFAPGNKIRVLAASTAPATPVTVTPASAQFDVGLEVTVGIAGSVKLWIDAGFDDPPTGMINVNNAQWGSIAGLSIGQTGNTAPYLATQAGKDVVFSGIAINDSLFLGSFE